ncbi:MAG TPA: hypothetical protein VFQ44_25565 [Streptosporangiaceae bacterium]|nr:hypothetical protein [Streptosporangiaceae bacterium]
MGMFKNMRDLQKMGRDAERNMPPVADRMADAQARMANAAQLIANQTAAANAAAAAAQGLADGTAIKRTVVINGMQQVGMINFDLLVQFDLTVMQDDMPPYPATAQQTVSQMQIGSIGPGMTVDGAIDPSNPSAIWLDLSTAR